MVKSHITRSWKTPIWRFGRCFYTRSEIRRTSRNSSTWGLAYTNETEPLAGLITTKPTASQRKKMGARGFGARRRVELVERQQAGSASCERSEHCAGWPAVRRMAGARNGHPHAKRRLRRRRQRKCCLVGAESYQEARNDPEATSRRTRPAADGPRAMGGAAVATRRRARAVELSRPARAPPLPPPRVRTPWTRRRARSRGCRTHSPTGARRARRACAARRAGTPR